MAKAEDQSSKPRWRKPHFYGWVLANVLAGCAALLGWVLCLYVFGNPEMPRNYRILERFDRAGPPGGFALQEAPEGEADDPKGLYRRYAGLNEKATSMLNRGLLRNYVSQLRGHALIQYVEGDFKVTNVRALTEQDVLQPGIAIQAQAMVKPDEFTEAAPWPVTIEYLVPTDDSSAINYFKIDDRIQLAKVPNCPALLRLTHDVIDETPHIILTVVPIAMGDYIDKDKAIFRVSPPKSLNPAADFPVFSMDEEEAS